MPLLGLCSMIVKTDGSTLHHVTHLAAVETRDHALAELTRGAVPALATLTRVPLQPGAACSTHVCTCYQAKCKYFLNKTKNIFRQQTLMVVARGACLDALAPVLTRAGADAALAAAALEARRALAEAGRRAGPAVHTLPSTILDIATEYWRVVCANFDIDEHHFRNIQRRLNRHIN